MKVAIVCGSPSSEFLAPFDDPEWEIWVLGNRLNKFDGKRVTRVFEIHDDLAQHQAGYAAWLVSKNIPLVVGEGFPEKASHVLTFPFAEAEKLFGSTYLTSSPAYMMALALLEGATEIGVYGVDMAVDDNEYFWQRPCMEAWIGFAKGRGVKITLPETSPVLKCHYVEGRESGGKPQFAKPPFTKDEFEGLARRHAEQIERLQQEIAERERGIRAHTGAKQVYDRLAKVARAIEAGQDIRSLMHSFSIR